MAGRLWQCLARGGRCYSRLARTRQPAMPGPMDAMGPHGDFKLTEASSPRQAHRGKLASPQAARRTINSVMYMIRKKANTRARLPVKTQATRVVRKAWGA